MDLGTISGIAFGLILIIGSIVAGGSADAFIDIPSIAVTLGGTVSAIFITFPMTKVKAVFAVTKKILNAGNLDMTPWYTFLVEIATVARRDGLLAMEERINQVDNSFLRNGLQMLVDGNTPEAVDAVLESEIENMQERHGVGHSIFKSMGDYAPAFGMIGTLMGLVQMLQNLDDPSKIGSGMAVALLTTFYGAFFANLFCIPIEGKLKQRTDEEVKLRRMLMTGVMAIQEGDSPRVVQSKLVTYLNAEERLKVESS